MKRGGGGGIWCIALVCILLSSGVAGAADGRDKPLSGLRATWVPVSARVGSIVTLTLSYHLPEGAHLPPDIQVKGLEGLTIEGRQTGPGEIRIRLLMDRLGTFKTGPLSLAYLDKEGEKQFLGTGPVQLTVLSNLGEKPGDAQLKPIYGIIPSSSRLFTYLPWVITALTACAAGVGLFLWLRRRGHGLGPAVFQAPPHVLARQEIDELESRRLFEKGHVKEFYFRFSEIIRRYLESLRGFPAAEYTTQEIALCIHNPQDREILPLLQQADLVKFADLVPTPARKDDELRKALSYIRETGPALEREQAQKAVQPRGVRLVRRWMKRSEETGR
ncbi:MAG: hypothetical protein KJ573_05125 [Proteobacteria bacterium]|nr:hypothetical protein [Pseudomonadota bacterium]MBU1902956.1 hypothetical protein [Pseudomonadota bacterium]